MKYFSLHILRNTLAMTLGIIVSLCLTVSCDDDMPEIPGNPLEMEDGYICINLECMENATKATEAAVDNLNENKINTVVLCLWASGGDHTDYDAPNLMMQFDNLNANGTAVLRVPLTSELVTNLFGNNNSNTCSAFVAVNVDKGDATTVADLRENVINSAFESRKTQSAFTMDGDGTVALFENRAVGKIEVKRSAAKFTLHLNVDETVTETSGDDVIEWTPSKSGMRVWLSQGVAVSQLDPKPTLDMDEDVYFNSSRQLDYTFRLSSEEADKDFPYIQDTPLYSYPNKWTEDMDEQHKTTLTLMVPWTSDGGKTYRTCYYQVPVVPLTSTETVRNTSYHIKLHVGMLGNLTPDIPTDIEADYYAANWGSENIDVDIKDYRYLVVDANNYTINNEDSIVIPFYTSHKTVVDGSSVKMKFYRFNFSDEGTAFEVPVSETQNEQSKKWYGEYVYEAHFNNTNNTLVVKHPLKVFEPYRKKATKVDLTNGGNKTNTRDKTQTTDAVDAVLGTIKGFKKTNIDEYSKVEFEVTVWHEDLHTYSETVKITQYPGIYIESRENYVAPNATSFSYNGAQGNTQINGNCVQKSGNYNSLGGNYQRWETSIGLSTGYLNWNPNLYLITITKLPENSEYIIGDPRSYLINNNLSNGSVDKGVAYTTAWAGGTMNGVPINGFTTAPALGESSKRTLKYYYPTIETSQTINMIAPKLRVCSSYGGTSAILTREMARRRAAAYQELGYAAGRWRLPTFAEVRFLMQMSIDDKIPRLFGRDSGVWYYWCAQGAVKVPKRGDTSDKVEIVALPTDGGMGPGTGKTGAFTGDNYADHARFVYDEWYWGEEMLPSSGTPNATKPTYTFTWGDRVKTNPEER